MRTTRGKATLDILEQGDPELSAILSDALAHRDRDDDLTHGFHAYPAGLHPLAARELVHTFGGPRVADPFCGGGTVLIEAMRAGHTARGMDLSPVAEAVARARTRRFDEEQCTRMRSHARRITELARQDPVMPDPALQRRLQDWYAPHALAELETLRRGIAEAPDPAVRAMLEVCWSSILVKVSWRRSETSARREIHRRPPGTTAVLFHKKVRELGRRLAALREAVPADTPESLIRRADARDAAAWPGDLDLVLTSPPYPTIYDYLPMQWLREIWLGLEPAHDAEIGARRHFRPRRDGGEGTDAAVARWRRDTDAWIGAAARALRPGGRLVVVVGDGLLDRERLDTLGPTLAAAEHHGLVPLAAASHDRPDHARGARRAEHALVCLHPEGASGAS